MNIKIKDIYKNFSVNSIRIFILFLTSIYIENFLVVFLLKIDKINFMYNSNFIFCVNK